MEKEQTKIILLLLIMMVITVLYTVFSGLVIYKFEKELDNSRSIHYTHR